MLNEVLEKTKRGLYLFIEYTYTFYIKRNIITIIYSLYYYYSFYVVFIITPLR